MTRTAAHPNIAQNSFVNGLAEDYGAWADNAELRQGRLAAEAAAAAPVKL